VRIHCRTFSFSNSSGVSRKVNREALPRPDAGVIVDRFHRKKIMAWMGSVQWIAVGALILLFIASQVQLWSLFVLGFLFSSAGYAFGNAHHSCLPQIVSKEQLTDANAKLSLADTLIRMIGPGAAGLLLAATHFQGALVVQFVCITVMLMFLIFAKVPPVESRTESGSVWSDMKEGMAALFGNKLLWVPTLAILFSNLASSLVLGVLVFFAVDVIGAGEKEVGFMFSMGAVGGIAGALVINRLRKKTDRGKLFIMALMLDTAGFGLLIFAHTWWIIGLALLIRTFAVTIINIIYLAVRQEQTPNHLLGRVAGTSSMLMKLAMPLGLVLAGLWAEWLPVRMLFIITVVIIICLIIWLSRTSFVRLR
jgi:MFS family permease